MTLTTEQNVRWAISTCCVFDQWSTPPPKKKKKNTATITTKLTYFIQLKLTNLMTVSLCPVETEARSKLTLLVDWEHPLACELLPCCAYEYFGLWVLHHNNHIYMFFWPFSHWAFYPHSRHPALHYFHSVVGSGVSWSHWQLVHRLTLDFLRDQLKKIARPLRPAIHKQSAAHYFKISNISPIHAGSKMVRHWQVTNGSRPLTCKQLAWPLSQLKYRLFPINIWGKFSWNALKIIKNVPGTHSSKKWNEIFNLSEY